MNEAEAMVPRFCRGFRLRRDEVRGTWVVLAPERVFVLDGPGSEALRLVDGARSIGAIIDALADRFAAPRATIAADVTIMLQDFAAKGAIQL